MRLLIIVAAVALSMSLPTVGSAQVPVGITYDSFTDLDSIDPSARGQFSLWYELALDQHTIILLAESTATLAGFTTDLIAGEQGSEADRLRVQMINYLKNARDLAETAQDCIDIALDMVRVIEGGGRFTDNVLEHKRHVDRLRSKIETIHARHVSE